MRRVLVLSMAVALSIVMALPAQAANAHFVPSSWTGTLAPTGVVKVGYQVTGLGPRASGYVRIKGWVTVSADCKTKRGLISHFDLNQDRVAEKGGYADKNGQYKQSMDLPPASICPPGSTLLYNATSPIYTYADMTMYLWEGTSAGSEASAADTFHFTCTQSGCAY